MNKIYYNPEVFTPITEITNVQEIKPDDPFYKLEGRIREPFCYETYEQAISSRWTGPTCWWQDGKLFKGNCIPANAYEALKEHEVQNEPGINWYDIYSLDPMALVYDYLRSYPECKASIEQIRKDVRYSEKLGVYSMHIHYCDGRRG